MNQAKVILDSIHPDSGRLITMELKVPTAVTAQLGTHRSFSKNAASMRAIPTKRVISSVLADPYIPEFGSNQAGMQAGEVIRFPRVAKAMWFLALYVAVAFSKVGARLGLHKQVINRLLSPWSYTKVVCTGNAAAWANFLALRCDSHADPAIRNVALDAKDAIRASVPQKLQYGEWHLPYVHSKKGTKENVTQSVARCARVSYRTFQDPSQRSSLEKDQELYEKLLGSQPIHASPAEHQAMADVWHQVELGGNLGAGWVQHRKTLANEFVTDLGKELFK